MVQRVNAHKIPGFAEELETGRHAEERTFFRHVADTFRGQHDDDHGATMEHPAYALSWETHTLSHMDNCYDVFLDRCRTGLSAYNASMEFLGLARKETRFRTTSLSVAQAQDLQCQCTEPHFKLTSTKLRDSQSYEPKLAKLLAESIVQDAVERVSEHIAYVEEGDAKQWHEIEYRELLNQLRAKFDIKVIKEVEKMHIQLGHPGPDRLAEECIDLGKPKEVSACARQYLCEHCLRRMGPKLFKAATLRFASTFNETVDIDCFFIVFGKKQTKHRILTVMDEFSRYEIDKHMPTESVSELIRLLEEGWIEIFGAPKTLRLDMHGMHMSKEFLEWATKFNIKLSFIPAECHHELGILERNHAVRREQIALYNDKFPEDPFEQVLKITCMQRNRLRGV